MAGNISILGSTGSIGRQTLEVARNLKINVVGLAADSSIDLLEKQALEFKPRMVAAGNGRAARILSEKLKGTGIEVYSGVEGLLKVSGSERADTVVSSIVGSAGLMPTLEAIKKGKNIALANKETLVTAGRIVMAEAQRHGARIIPVDSEHSAIFQCLEGNRGNRVKKIILTASGGPFRGRTKAELERVTVEEALNHPNWKMGDKISIDSATLMNKGLEVIEAKWLFGLDIEQIEVIVHPQSIVHSMVEFTDGTVMAQLGPSDMRLPIQYALTYPERVENNFSRLDLVKAGTLTFEKPDYESFPCLGLAFDALKAGGTMPAVMNAANEAAVRLFLNRKIRFIDISGIIENVMKRHSVNTDPALDDIIEVDEWARNEAEKIMEDFV